jgi:hypothetical protein
MGISAAVNMRRLRGADVFRTRSHVIPARMAASMEAIVKRAIVTNRRPINSNMELELRVSQLGGKFFAQAFHLGEGVLVVGAVGGGDAFVEAGEGFFGAA